jgi:hypothetical protein
MGSKKNLVNVMIILACVFSLTVPCIVLSQDYCDSDANADLKVDLSDLVIMKGEFLRTDCAPCAMVADLQAQVTSLQATVAQLTSLLQGVTRNDDDITFSGVNVHIVDGSGDTYGDVNGLGNLIVGYNESRGENDIRTGSHNIVVGREHNYSSYGGLVVGIGNTISGPYASVSGGWHNTASGPYASVSGGAYNTASGYIASVSGGYINTASGDDSSVSGGESNTASGHYASVSGGQDRSATGTVDWAAGGLWEDQ